MAAPHNTQGLAFKKLDLHLHTPASSCFSDKSVAAKQIVQAALDAGLTAIAVTDHNSGAWIDRVHEAANGTDLVVFPGVEITCMGGKEGIHVIALFDPSQGQSHVESLLGDLELTPEQYGDRTTIVRKTPIEVIETVHRRGGITVLAHANSTRGAMCDMRGEQRTVLVQHPHLCGVEATDFGDEAAKQQGKRLVDLLDGSDPTYRRALAVYQASDNPSGEADGRHGLVGIGTRCAWFKLDKVSLEGLRQCFHDPTVRIRQDFEYSTQHYPRIKRIKISSGFLDNSEATFHEGLNSVLGGKGAGKSLLVEFMRFGLDQTPQNADIRADHDRKLESRLEEFGTVELLLSDETGKEFTVKRTFRQFDDSPYEDGTHDDIARSFPMLFLSQNEIIRIAESEKEQIAFIDRFFDFRSYTTQIEQLERDLAQKDSELADCLRAYEQASLLTKTVQTTKSEISKLDAALKNPAFEEFRKLEAKDRAFRSVETYLEDRQLDLQRFEKEMKAQSTPELDESLQDDPALKRAVTAAEAVGKNLLGHLEEAAKEINVKLSAVKAEHEKGEPAFVEGKKRYETAVQQGGGDYKALALKRAKLTKDIEETTRRLTAVKQRSDRMKVVAESRQEQIGRLKETYDRYTEERREKCSKFETESAGKLQVRIHESSNRDVFRSRLLAMKRGSYLRDAEIETLCQTVDPTEFVRAIINYALKKNTSCLADTQRASGLELSQLQKFVEFLLENMKYEDLLALQYQAMPQDRPDIKYNVGRDAFEPLERVSTGQKCTAMLIMALSDGTVPVVIDQPEDSLDIRSVWEDMCLKIRRGKENRQFIFTTHNSSLAVASDSDKFVILEGDATKGRVVFSGSMDHGPVSDEVLRYLEGGLPTYRLKYLKYNAEERLRGGGSASTS